MGMSDCPKCLDTPCECGWEYRNYGAARLDDFVRILLGVKKFKEEHPGAIFSSYTGPDTADDLALMKFLRANIPDAETAGTVQKTREELAALNLESPSYWKTDAEVNESPLTGVAVYDEIKRLKKEISVLQTCKTCDGDGIMSVLTDVLPPDETEVYDEERCAECDGTGIGYFARTSMDLKAAKELLGEVLGHVYSWQQTGDLKDRIQSFLQPNMAVSRR